MKLDPLCPPLVGRFLEYLGGNPAGDEVAEALALGPLRIWGCYAVSIYSASLPTELELRGTYGMTEEVRRRYGIVSMYSASSSVRAFREGRVFSRSIGAIGGELNAAERHIVRDFLKAPSGSEACLVSTPLVGRGHSIGALNVCLTRPLAGTPEEHRHLEAVAAALSMWLLIHETARQAWLARPRALPSSHVRVSERQLDVLGLMSQGMSNKDISAELSFSESTVKKDIQALMVFLDVRDRAAAVERGKQLGLLGQL